LHWHWYLFCVFNCSEVSSAQPKDAWISDSQPADRAHGRTLDHSGTKQLPISGVTSGAATFLKLRCSSLIGGDSQRRGGRWQIREL
jgi:hypothetical protein